MSAKRLVVLACLVAPILDAVLTAANADREDNRAVPKGADTRRGYSGRSSMRREEGRREEEYDDDDYNYHDEDTLIAKNRKELKRMYLEATGRELMDDDIDGAIRSAHERGLQIVATGWDAVWEEEGRLLEGGGQAYSRKLLATNKDYVFVSGLSPGWDENYGRNEFYCAAVKKIKWRTMRPKRGERIVLSDCSDTSEASTSFRYNAGKDIKAKKIDTVAHNWCLETRNNSTSKLYINHCDIFNPLQLFAFDDAKKTWGLENGEPNKCFTAEPPKSRRKGKGSIKLQNCTEEGRTREAQVFRPCETKTGCTFDAVTNFLVCDLEARCR